MVPRSIECKRANQIGTHSPQLKSRLWHFTQYGRLDASAEADVIASGFGPLTNGEWRCKTVENTCENSGFTTTIEVEAKEKPK